MNSLEERDRVAEGGRKSLREATQRQNAEQARILLGLLESVERDETQSQRQLATELGIALGLLNAYLKRCIRKGLVKMRRAPARRYAYYLTPRGFAEKSRLTIEYLSFSLDFFRQAKADCRETLDAARRSGFARVVLAGRSDLTEIALICALESGVEIVAVVDAAAGPSRFMGVPAFDSFEQVKEPFDAVVVTDLVNGPKSYACAIAALGAEHVLIPKLLRSSAAGARLS
jgi:DNA-binding MarR family transcriptional regulator